MSVTQVFHQKFIFQSKVISGYKYMVYFLWGLFRSFNNCRPLQKFKWGYQQQK